MMELTPTELESIGRYVVTLLGAMQLLGHTSPAQSVMYAQADGPEAQLVIDAFTLCLPGVDTASNRLRIESFLDEHDVAAKIAAAVER